MQYTIHRCLTELKTLDNRIYKKINDLNLVGSKKGSSDRVLETLTNEKQFSDIVKSDYMSVNKLIGNRNKIKKAVVLSNASTIVEIGGVEYTVAEAIERKNSISFEEDLLRKMKGSYKDKMAKVNNNNERMEMSLSNQESKMRENGQTADDIKLSTELYRKQNEWALIDPINIRKETQDLEENIENFLMEVDHVLSTSNATTVVEIDLD